MREAHALVTGQILQASGQGDGIRADALRKVATAAGHPNFPAPQPPRIWPGRYEARLEGAVRWARYV